MLGPDAAGAALADRYRLELPDKLDALDARLGRVAIDADDQVRAPRLVEVWDRGLLTLGDYPAVLVIPQAAENLRPAGIEGGAETFLLDYPCRVFAFNRGADRLATAAGRSRLVLALRELTLARLRLGDWHRVTPRGYRESYSEVELDESDAVAGVFLLVTVTAEEPLSDLTDHQAGTVVLDVSSPPEV